METEFLDSLTNERLAAVVDRKRGSHLDVTWGYTKWGYAKTAIKTWTRELRQALDEISGRK
jgi:hypothetical protein